MDDKLRGGPARTVAARNMAVPLHELQRELAAGSKARIRQCHASNLGWREPGRQSLPDTLICARVLLFQHVQDREEREDLAPREERRPLVRKPVDSGRSANLSVASRAAFYETTTAEALELPPASRSTQKAAPCELFDFCFAKNADRFHEEALRFRERF